MVSCPTCTKILNGIYSIGPTQFWADPEKFGPDQKCFCFDRVQKNLTKNVLTGPKFFGRGISSRFLRKTGEKTQKISLLGNLK